MKVLHAYCFNPFDMLSEHELLVRECCSLEFEKALQNSNIPNNSKLGFLFSNPFGLKGLESFEAVVDLEYHTPEEVLAELIPSKRDYYDILIAW